MEGKEMGEKTPQEIIIQNGGSSNDDDDTKNDNECAADSSVSVQPVSPIDSDTSDKSEIISEDSRNSEIIKQGLDTDDDDDDRTPEPEHEQPEVNNKKLASSGPLEGSTEKSTPEKESENNGIKSEQNPVSAEPERNDGEPEAAVVVEASDSKSSSVKQEIDTPSSVDSGSTPTSTTTTDESSGSNEEEDVEAAASAMAAVAVAICNSKTNQNLSPSEKAELARTTIQKQPLLQKHTTNEISPLNMQDVTREALSVNLEFVRKSMSDSTMNEALLRVLVLFSSSYDIVQKKNMIATEQKDGEVETILYSTSDGDEETSTTADNDGAQQNTTCLPENKENQKQIQIVSKAVIKLYSQAEEAYNELLALLPKLPSPSEEERPEKDKDERIVLDLLPPCVSPDDATAAFFQACNFQKPPRKKKKKKDYVTSTSDGLEISQKLASPKYMNGNANLGNNTTSSRAKSVITSIAGAATGVVGGIIQNRSNNNNNNANNTTSPTRGAGRSLLRRNRSQPTQPKPQQPEQSNKQQPQSPPDENNSETNNDITVASSSSSSSSEDSDVDDDLSSCEGENYTVEISREMLGLTVENVLERTIVRTVLATGAAKKAGAKVGSLIVQVGQVKTHTLTHFETIDELRQSQRPLKLVLRKIGSQALQGAREEMGRLIKGVGFGNHQKDKNHYAEKADFKEILSGIYIKKKKPSSSYMKSHPTQTSRKNELEKIEKRLVWILTLLCVGLEREAENASSEEQHHDFHNNKHSEKEHYTEAAKSISKILLDYLTKQFIGNPEEMEPDGNDQMMNNNANMRQQQMMNRYMGVQNAKSKKQQQFVSSQQQNNKIRPSSAQQQQVNPRSYPPSSLSNNNTEPPLLQIGDVLHRAQSYLADPFSPPAALLRGEVIALLCDVLDQDTEMELSDVEGSKATDLGSAGSLLKLIVRNCELMRSPGCEEGDHKAHAGNRFLAVVHKLASSRSTSSRVTACSLGPVLWNHLDFPHQLQLRGVITRALHDVEVIVRTSTAGVLHEIAELVFDSRAVPWLVLMCERAMTDPEPQLRSAAMFLTWHLAEHLPNAFLGDASKGSRSLRRLPERSDPIFADVYLLQCKLLPVATRLAEDRSFAVRLAVAAQCDRLCAALGDHWSSVIIDLLQALLGDNDDKVRSEAILCMPRLVESVLTGSDEIGVLEALLPTALKLLRDPSPLVRISLATSCGELLTLLVGLGSYEELTTFSSQKTFHKHKRHIDQTLIPLVQKLLHDRDPEVTSAALRAVTNASRGNVKEISSENEKKSTATPNKQQPLEKKPVFIPVLSEDQVLRLLPTLSNLAMSPQWRVRQSAVEIVPALLGCTQRLETRSRIAQLCVQLMEDQVDAVRKTAAECLCLGGGGFSSDNSEWVTAIVIPHLQSLKESVASKQRLLSLKMVEVLLRNAIISTEQKIILETAASLANDKVPNVRLTVGKVLSQIMGHISRQDIEYVLSVMEIQYFDECKRDNPDRDVLFYAKQTIKIGNEHLLRKK